MALFGKQRRHGRSMYRACPCTGSDTHTGTNTYADTGSDAHTNSDTHTSTNTGSDVHTNSGSVACGVRHGRRRNFK
jgi:hypothetical protein